MAAIHDPHADSTVVFLPHRLNRQPVVFRGLTADELWTMVGLSAACGFLLGVAFAALTQQIAMVPTSVAIAVAVGVFIGGEMLRRRKRGRPDTWLHRNIQWSIGRRFPSLAPYVGASDLITRSGYWTTRRETR